MTIEDFPLSVSGDRFRLERTEDTIAVVRVANNEIVGRFELELGDDALVIRSLCIHELRRGHGAGSEAALLLNRACDAADVPVVRAWAPPDRGLAVYFWIRMGFRPIHGEGPDGGLWFERRKPS